MKMHRLLLTSLAFSLVCPAALGDGLTQLEARAKRPPSEPAQALGLGRELRQAGSFKLALRVLRGAYGRAGKGDVAAELRYEAARTLIEDDQQKQAVRECRALRALSSVKAAACEAEAHLLWKRASLALPLADKALAESSNDYDALVAKGRALAQMGRTKEAKAAFESAATADAKRYEAHAALGELLALEGNTSAAALALNKASAAAPNEPAPLLALGDALKTGPKAEKALREAVKIRPSYGAAHASLGRVLLARGDGAAAESAYRKALAVDVKQADWHAGLGRALLVQKQPDKALGEAAQALALVKNHAGAKLVEADAKAAKGDIDLAIEAYEQAHGYAPLDPTPLVHAARACLAQARPTTARAFAERATDTFPKHGPGWLVLGDVAVKTGDKVRARTAYKKAVALGGVDKSAAQRKLSALR